MMLHRTGIDIVEECLLVAVADRDIDITENDALATDVGDTSEIDDVGTMHTHELV